MNQSILRQLQSPLTLNPPSSMHVMERLRDCLTPPITSASPTPTQVRGGAYDGMHAHCIGEAQKPSPALQAAYRECVRVIRLHSKSFYFSARLLPAHKRNGIMALYAFCRLTDDLVDEVEDNSAEALRKARCALDTWAARNRAWTVPFGESSGSAVAAAWADTRRRCSIPTELPDDLIAGVRMDLTLNRYQTWDDLWLYCYRVASTVGLMSMYITGAQTMDAVPYAVQLGVALQLTNILRDVGEDARSGRIYLPLEDMDRFGYTEEMLLAGVRNEQFSDLMEFEVHRAQALYNAAWAGIAMLPPDSRMAVAAAGLFYRRILDKITTAQYDVFSQRAHLTLSEKLKALPGLWWSTRAQS
ncbi:MAG: phytoene/squalene synthase family protein [Chloroflexota bacterium]